MKEQLVTIRKLDCSKSPTSTTCISLIEIVESNLNRSIFLCIPYELLSFCKRLVTDPYITGKKPFGNRTAICNGKACRGDILVHIHTGNYYKLFGDAP